MEVHKGNIFGILNGDKQFLIPVYQRYYSWELEQCKRLWNDIVVMQKEKKDEKWKNQKYMLLKKLHQKV